MKLPVPSPRYDPSREADRNRQIEQADQLNHKKNRDVEVSPGRLILVSPDGTRFSIEVSNAGVVSATAL